MSIARKVPSHRLVPLLAGYIAGAADEAPPEAGEREIIEVALDAATGELAARFGEDVAQRVVSDERVCGSNLMPGLCDHLLAFHRSTGGSL